MADDIKGLDAEISDIIITLLSQDDQKYNIKCDVAKNSQLIKTMVEQDKNASIIPLPHIKGNTLKSVVEFLNHHHGIPLKTIERPLKSNNMKDVVPEWDANFIDVDVELLFEIILAANYMDIRSLLDLSCAKLASLLKGKKAEEIRAQFNIENDFTVEEEEIVRKENEWAQDV